MPRPSRPLTLASSARLTLPSSGKPKPRSHGPNRVSPSASIWVRSQVADPEQFCHWDMVGGISNGVLYIVSRCHVSLPSPPVSPARADLPR